MKAQPLFAILAASAYLTAASAQESSTLPLVEAIDPMIGAITLSGYGGHGLGKTFPGAALPFGMCQVSPDTITGGDNGPGYSYHHQTIEGFSFFHMSGIGWFGDLGNFQVMPSLSPSRFDHAKETAKAGYYSVMLDDPGVFAEATVAPKGGMLRFTYPESAESVLSIDLSRRIGELRRAKQVSRQRIEWKSDTEFTGEIVCNHADGGWGRGGGKVDYTVFFHGISSKSLANREVSGDESNLVVRVKFPTAKDEQVILHVNFSYSALPPAPKGFDFDAMRRDANESWKRVLDGFDVKGGTAAERRIFATAIYHSMIDPRRIDSYPMGNGYTLERTVFSGWDVFRSEMPLLCLIAPETVAETVDSMMKVMEAGRRDTLPVWDLFGCKSSCMLGNPLIPVMLSALDAGINIDLGRALPLVEKTMKLRGNGNRGYCENDISKTLEYCYDYWCAARLAERAGNKELMARMDEHSRDYTNIWDETVGWMHGRGRDREGEKTWSDWKGLTVHGQGCVESNPYQQGWFVPHDVPGLIGLMGGEEKFIENLVPFFEKAPKDFLWGDYYNHPNEPSHHIAFLFAAANRPWLTQKWTRAILANAYQDNVRGLCGNDDVGQMSAWYVLAAIGINPMCPGSGRWVVSTPLFERVSLPVKDATSGKIRPFTVIAKGAGDPKNIYITSAKLNGRPLERAWLYTKEIMSGSTLELQLGPEPNEKLFTEKW